jgi:hypothetical protein
VDHELSGSYAEGTNSQRRGLETLLEGVWPVRLMWRTIWGSWCGWRDSNSHGFPSRPLKTVCLPVPPHPQIQELNWETQAWGGLGDLNYSITLITRNLLILHSA